MAEHNDFGKWGEEYAARYLLSKGYVIRHRDWHLAKRDIDIVAVAPDGHTVVFVEVKTRSYDSIMRPEEAVTITKMCSIVRCANAYIKMFNITNPTRFDIIGIVRHSPDNIDLKHMEKAFQPHQLPIRR